LDDCSVDAIVTDPPYELAFMGRKWDSSGVAYDPEVWEQALRVLKPGGHLLAFGGTRTWHRLAVAIEDAGFEVRDSIAWMYGSGFPKSLDVSKAIDKAAGHWRGRAGVIVSDNDAMTGANYKRTPKGDPATPADQQWQGWGTALKPAFEPIVVARKPLDGTVAENVLRWGTGALNIDGSRIGTTDDTARSCNGRGNLSSYDLAASGEQRVNGGHTAGRWPANVILDESQAAELDKQSGSFGGQVGMRQTSGKVTFTVGEEINPKTFEHGVGDFGGASRLFYVAKANKKERPNVDGVAHPTVKPLALMRYLVNLVTPPEGTVLDPFAGSGATLEAALDEGFHVIGIELTDEYLPLIRERIRRATENQQGRLL